MQLRKDIENLKIFVLNQDESHNKVKADIEILKMQYLKMIKSNRLVRYMIEKHKEQKIQIDLLVKLMQEKLSDHECKCRLKVEDLSKCHQNESAKNTLDTIQTVDEDITVKNHPVFHNESKVPKGKFTCSEIQNESNVTKEKFTYTESRRMLIGQTNPEYPRVGRVISLNQEGCCQFEVSDHKVSSLAVNWSNLCAAKPNSNLYSKYILLPDQWDGLILRVKFFYQNKKEFAIGVYALDITHNETVPLPQSVGLQIQMTLLNGRRYTSPVHHFHLDKLRSEINIDDSFLRIPLIDVDPNNLPNITLQFYMTS